MGHEVRLAGVADESVVDGPGLRFTVFLQGCPHRCPGCHNPETHDPGGGHADDTDALLARFQANPLLSGMTLSGGEPFLQPGAALALARGVRAAGKHLIVFTGYRCEELARKAVDNEAVRALLEHADLLVDGRYEENLRDLNLPLRGSANQRVLGRAEIQECLQRACGAERSHHPEIGIAAWPHCRRELSVSLI